MFNETTNLWEVDGEALNLRLFISSVVYNLFENYIQFVLLSQELAPRASDEDASEDDTDQFKNLKTMMSKLKNVSFKDCLEKECRTIMKDKDFLEKLDNVPAGYLPFTNGLLDAITKEFRPFQIDDYVCTTVGYEYIAKVDFTKDDQSEYDFYKDMYEKTFPNKNLRDFQLRFVGNALMGTPEKAFLLSIDEEGRSGNNNKSGIMDCTIACFGDFCMGKQKNLWNMNRAQGQNSHQANEVCNRHSKLMCQDETDEDVKLDYGKMRDDTAGASGKRAARNAGADKLTKFTPKYSCWLSTNINAFPRDPRALKNEGLIDRVLPVTYESRFYRTQKELDTAINVRKEKNAYLSGGNDFKLRALKGTKYHVHFFIDGYEDFCKRGGLDVPAEIINARSKVLCMTDDCQVALEQFIDECFSPYNNKIGASLSLMKCGSIPKFEFDAVKTLTDVMGDFKAYAKMKGVPPKQLDKLRDRMLPSLKEVPNLHIEDRWQPYVMIAGKLTFNFFV
jgi:hypothetical protein